MRRLLQPAAARNLHLRRGKARFVQIVRTSVSVAGDNETHQLRESEALWISSCCFQASKQLVFVVRRPSSSYDIRRASVVCGPIRRGGFKPHPREQAKILAPGSWAPLAGVGPPKASACIRRRVSTRDKEAREMREARRRRASIRNKPRDNANAPFGRAKTKAPGKCRGRV